MAAVCRTCLSQVNNTDCLSLKENSVSGVIRSQLALCVPEIVIDKVTNPVMCYTCINALHAAFNFKYSCIRTEQRIKTYSKEQNSPRTVNLLALLPKKAEENKELDLVTNVLNTNKRSAEVACNSREPMSECSDLLDNQMPKLEPIDETNVTHAEGSCNTSRTCDLEKWNTFENNHLDGVQLNGRRSTRNRRATRTWGMDLLKVTKPKKQAKMNGVSVNSVKNLNQTRPQKHNTHRIQPKESPLKCNVCKYTTKIEIDMEMHHIFHLKLKKPKKSRKPKNKD